MRVRAVLKAQDPLETAFRNVYRNQFELQRQIRQLKSQLLSPTMPRYDPDYPDDAVDGQYAISTDPPEDTGDSLMRPYYKDPNGWHPFNAARRTAFVTMGGSQTVALLSGNGGIPGTVDFTSQPGSWASNDTDNGSSISTGSLSSAFDTDHFSYDDGTPNRVGVDAGLYVAVASLSITGSPNTTLYHSMDLAIELAGGTYTLGSVTNDAVYSVIDFTRVAFSPTIQMHGVFAKPTGGEIGVSAGHEYAGGALTGIINLGVARVGSLKDG